MGYLKTEKRFIESLGEELEIVELNNLASGLIAKAQHEGSSADALAIAVKYGTTKWPKLSPDELSAILAQRHIIEIAAAVMEVSGFDDDPEKNSESTQ